MDSNFELPENADELLEILGGLKSEEEMLKKMVLNIEKQLHALEIEKMHLINTLSKDKQSSSTSSQEVTSKTDIVKTELLQSQNQSKNLDVDLNLQISSKYKFYDEEDENSEEDDDSEDYM